MELQFKNWITEKYEPMRDIRYGYDLRNRPTPHFLQQAGSSTITGFGDILRKRMGSAFPAFGSGYHDYFSDLTKVFTNNQNFIVQIYEPYKEDEDIKTMTKTALQDLHKYPEVENEANRYNINLNFPDKIQHDFDKNMNAVKFVFTYRLKIRTSDRLQMQRVQPLEPNEEV